MADSTSDSTAIIIAVQSATANMLVNDFSDQSESILTQSTSIFNTLEDIKAEISGISPGSFTPPSVLDGITEQALNASFGSSAWLMGQEGLAQAQQMKNECDVLRKVGKYVDTGGMIESMKSGIMKDALDAIDNAGAGLPEFDIGKKLSSIINVGKSIYDRTATAFSGTVSDVLEHGKGGLAVATSAIDKANAAVDGAVEAVQSGITSLSSSLKILDGMTNCVDAVGGSDFASQADQMIDRSNDIFDKLGVESDPASANFGEFDENVYLDSIGGLTPIQKSNILKGINTYNKGSNNASQVVDKAIDGAKLAPETEKSTSSLSSGGTTSTVEEKVTYVQDEVKVEVEVPAIPDGAPAQTIEPKPVPVPPPSTAAPAPPVEEVILLSNLVKEIRIRLTGSSDYDFYDPEHLGYERYKAAVMKLLPPGGIDASLASIGQIVGILAIDTIDGDHSTISSSITYEYEATALFTWGVETGILGPHTNRGLSTSVETGEAWIGPMTFKRGGGGISPEARDSDGVIEATMDAIVQMKLQGGNTDKYFKILYEKLNNA